MPSCICETIMPFNLPRFFPLSFKRIHAGFEQDAVQDIENEMIRISNSPILIPRMPFGKHKGALFSEIPTDYLRSFPDLEIVTEDYENATQMSNACRRKGVQGSHTDFLICAVANRYDLAVFTTDGDFEFYKRHIPITLYKLGERG